MSASITKRNAANAPDKLKENLESLTQPVLKRIENPGLGMTGQSRRPARSILSEIHTIDQRPPSSDYGDNSFDDLPSPSAFLRECGTTPEAPRVNDKKVRGDDIEASIFDEPWDTVQSPSRETPVQLERVETAAKPVGLLQGSTQPESLVASSCIPGLEAILSSSQILEADTEPLLASSADLCSSGVQKRKSHPGDETTGNEGKKLKQCTPNTAPERKTTVLSERAPLKQNTVSAQPEPLSGQKDWVDIDPTLLDEFKDIVNFF